jgi:hypothetical protein
MILEDFFHDFGHGFLLKNLAVGGAREKPEPRNNLGVIVAEAVVTPGASETANETIPVTHVIASLVKRDSHLLANNIFLSYGMVFREKLR